MQKLGRTGTITVILLVMSIALISDVRTVEANGTIYIRPDGPVDLASRIRQIRPGPEVILVIMIDFPDQTGVQAQVYYQNLLFGGTFGTMNHYFKEVSYGLLTLTVAMAGAGWCRSSENMVWWGEDDETLGNDNANALILELAREAVVLADANVNFKAYDTNNDSIIEPDELSICIVHAGNDQGPSSVSTDIVSHAWIIYGQGYRWTERGGGNFVDTFVDGCRISRHPDDSTDVGLYFMCAETDSMGTFAHEFAHILGLPDLYSAKTGWVVGVWSLMDEGGRAPHLDPWSKVQLGWLSPTVVEDYLVTTVDQTESTSGNRLYRLNIEGTQQYFLIENRQQTGYDSCLPEAGVLIWHIDEAMQNNTSIPPKVALEQPGGSLDTAAYSSNDGQTTFDLITTPNSNANDGTATSISVWGIGAEGPSMNVTFFRATALSFDGQNDIVRVPDSDSLDLKGVGTIEAWIKYQGGLVTQGFISKASTMGNNAYYNNYYLEIVNGVGLGAGIGAGEGIGNGVDVFDVVTKNVWMHVAFSWNGTILKLYKDGIEIGSEGQTIIPTINDKPLFIGRESASTYGYFFQGLIDEVRIWRIARSQKEIQGNMNTTLIGNKDGLVAYWKFDEGNGQRALDATANRNDGQLGSTSGTDYDDPTWVEGLAFAPALRDIAITNIAVARDRVAQGYSIDIGITVANQGTQTETLSLVAYAGTVPFEVLSGITLASGLSTTLTVIWNTSGYALGDYIISATVTTLPGETDTADNTLTNGSIAVILQGDINNDGTVDIYDALILAGNYGRTA